jgi:hypothetical protein
LNTVDEPDIRITQTHMAHYREHGYVVVEDFLSAKELAGAQADIETLHPGWLDFCVDPTVGKPSNWQQSTRSRFPFPGEHLNAITVHSELRRMAAELAGSDELYCEQSDLNLKCQGHIADADQQMHCDYLNHTLVYPPDQPSYWQTAYLLYYTDVTEAHAPTAVCSRKHYPEKTLWPAMVSPDARPELYDNEIKVVVPAGSLLAYSMRTFHRGTLFRDNVGRVAQFITYAPAAWKWLGIVGWGSKAIRPDFARWISSASLAERAVFGFPPPGHPYWSEETLAGVGARYPAMDMAPYRQASLDDTRGDTRGDTRDDTRGDTGVDTGADTNAKQQ